MHKDNKTAADVNRRAAEATARRARVAEAKAEREAQEREAEAKAEREAKEREPPADVAELLAELNLHDKMEAAAKSAPPAPATPGSAPTHSNRRHPRSLSAGFAGRAAPTSSKTSTDSSRASSRALRFQTR